MTPRRNDTKLELPKIKTGYIQMSGNEIRLPQNRKRNEIKIVNETKLFYLIITSRGYLISLRLQPKSFEILVPFGFLNETVRNFRLHVKQAETKRDKCRHKLNRDETIIS